MNSQWLSALSSKGALFDAGRVIGFEPYSVVNASDTQLCDLSHYGIMHVAGEDAATFLQGQLCNDVLRLEVGDAQWNGWCSPKGRLLATFLLWRTTAGYYAQLPRILQATIQKRLQMYVLRAKVRLIDVSDDLVSLGIAGKMANTSIHAAFGAIPDAPRRAQHTAVGSVIRLSADRFVVVANVERAISHWEAFAAHARAVGAGVWDRHSILEGLIEVLPETQDAFVPQMANFELIGGVSFKKGCYTGQEIVARTQYRGILKRRMVRVHGESMTLPKPGDSVFSPAFPGQAAGQIANVAASPAGGFDALVVAQIDAIKGNALTLENDTPLSVLPLPYEVTLPA